MDEAPSTAGVDTVDTRLPPLRLAMLGLQHVLVMAASPITAVFLVAKALSLPDHLAVDLISATFLVCGVGTLVQSFGPFNVGARLPFVMIPGGAPVVMFVVIARQTNLQTATGAVLLSGLLYFLVLPLFARLLKFFPRIVIGTILILVSVNLIKIYGSIIVGRPGSLRYGDPLSIGLALSTVAFTVFFSKMFKGFLGQLAVMPGLVCGALLAAALGMVHLGGVWASPFVAAPSVLPFGMPHFNVLASLPLLIFAVVSMTEATGQTVVMAEVVGKRIDPGRMVPRTIRGDALMSLLGGLFGTSLIITSSENIGIVQATSVRSRHVTATAGVILVGLAMLAPLARLINAVPAPVIGGTAMIVFSIIGVMGINMLRQVDLHERAPMYTLATALMMGFLPILVPGMYSKFPATLQLVLNNGLAMGSITAVVVNIVFEHMHRRPSAGQSAAAANLEPPVTPNVGLDNGS